MTTLGKYELHEVIGKGGFGTVYRATDQALGRTVAVKVLHPQWAVDPAFIERFSHEARVLASLEHPNIVWVFDAGEMDGRYYLVERYLPGGSLADRLKKGSIPMEEASRILREVCAGLQELHRQGWVHRDLKPANILFDASGQAVITDFGLARAMAESGVSSSSSAGGAGTPFYRAPELWNGKPPASPATDVYSLGCILGEMLTGKPLFGGDTPEEVLTRHLVHGPDFGENWPPESVPQGVVEVVEKSLRRDPAQRHADAQAFTNALAGVRSVEEKTKAATENARHEAEAAKAQVRQQASDREKARLAAAEQARRAAEEEARKREPILPDPRKIPWWGWLGGALLGLAALGFVFYLVVTAAQALLPGQTATQVPTQALVVVPTAVPTTALTTAPTTAPTAVPALDAKVPPACTEVGQEWVSPVDGMTLVCVPAGKFAMGSNDGDDDEKPVHDVNLDAYWMDRTEVSNRQYAQCVAAGGCTAPADTSSSTRDSYYGNATYNDYPVINVNWHQAGDYCAWAGRGLPTEAQWEKAARGTEGYIYPWGNIFDGSKANFADKNTNFDWSDKSVDDGYAETAPVGSYPTGASPYGALDMAGNVWEWTADWYGPYPSGEQSNPTGPATGEIRVLRGGSWVNYEYFLRSSTRVWYTPGDGYSNLGFRCSRSLP